MALAKDSKTPLSPFQKHVQAFHYPNLNNSENGASVTFNITALSMFTNKPNVNQYFKRKSCHVLRPFCSVT